MKAVLVLVAVLFVAALNVHALNIRTVPAVPRIGFVWAADNSTNGNQTNVTLPVEHVITFDRAFYNVTKIILSFPYTSNHAVEDISTVGHSEYSYDFTSSGGANGVFTFIAHDVDIYTFTFKADYDNSSTRDLQMAIWQGDLPLENYVWTETGTEFLLHFRMNMIQQPSYPSDIDVAHQVVYQLQQYLQQILTAQTTQLNTLQQANLTNSVVSMSAAIAAIVAAFLAGFGARRRRMSPE
jgi:hypothetical protein